MRVVEEQEKREALRSLLIELSASQEVLRDARERSRIFLQLEEIYYNCGKDNFRHYYSDIFAVLTIIDSDRNIGSLDVLAQNIQAIKDGYKAVNVDEQGKPKDISKEIIKLYDHTNLEIARINYTNYMTDETKSELIRNKNLIVDLERKVDESERKSEDTFKQTKEDNKRTLEALQKNQKDMQKDYIAILGIFASIVLSFTAGMAFSTSVLDNIYKSSIYRTVIVASLVGMVFIVMIWLLMDFVRSIHGEQKRKYIFVIIPEIVLALMIVLSVIAYKCDWFSGEEKITYSIYENNTEYEEYESIE